MIEYILKQSKGRWNAAHESAHASLADLSRAWNRMRDDWERAHPHLRASDFPDGRVVLLKSVVGYVSWNGNVWRGTPRAWQPGMTPIQASVQP